MPRRGKLINNPAGTDRLWPCMGGLAIGLSVQHLPLDAFFELTGMLQELADIHLTVIDHTVCPPDLGTFILVEEVLAKDKLYLLELLNPHLLREITERSVICRGWGTRRSPGLRNSRGTTG